MIQKIEEEGPGFVSCHPSFARLVGPQASLRLIIKQQDGLPLFHEAGIYLKNEKAVYLSSNRIATRNGGQRIFISRIPVELIPPPPGTSLSKDNVLPPLAESEPDAFQKLQASLKTQVDLGSDLRMPNGATAWCRNGREEILWCEQGMHDLTGSERKDIHASLVSQDGEGRTEVVLDSYQGKRFSSLNDVILHPQTGIVFFTDPDYGVGQSFKRARATKGKDEYAPNGLYSWDPSTGRVRLIDDRYDKPNGVTFVPDPTAPESGNGLLITTETGRFGFQADDSMGIFTVDESKAACIYSYKITVPSKSSHSSSGCMEIGERQLVGHSDCPVPDGIHPDSLGNVWTGNGDGLHIWNPWSRELLGKILLPHGKGVANFCWAGPVQDGCVAGDLNTAFPSRPPMYRLLLFAEDEVWEACVAVNGQD